MANARTELVRMKAANAAAAARRRMKSNSVEAMLVRHGAGVDTAIVLGVMKRNEVPDAMGVGPDANDKGFPWKPLLGTGALIAAAMTKGHVSAGFEGIAIGANAVYANRATVDGTLIAGA